VGRSAPEAVAALRTALAILRSQSFREDIAAGRITTIDLDEMARDLAAIRLELSLRARQISLANCRLFPPQ
jgi:hypothetical protein